MHNSLNRYDNIAVDYGRKRKKPWKYFIEFLEKCEENDIDIERRLGSICCDLGCGTGRHTDVLMKYCDMYIGTDLSFRMLTIANGKLMQEQYIACDMKNMPLRNECLSSIVSIAVVHHLRKNTDRKHALKEIKRLIEANGAAIFSVWSAIKGRNSKAVKRKRFRKRMAGSNADNNEPKTLFLPWKCSTSQGRSIEIMRVYHLYTLNELFDFEKEFDVKYRAIIGDERAGNNYFLLALKPHDRQSTA